MNPVLLKPQADRTSQLVVHGKVRGTLATGDFREARAALLDDVLASYRRLRAQCDIVVVEGAGSPAEINLRAGDIANMGFARAAAVPVVLVGDIDRGDRWHADDNRSRRRGDDPRLPYQQVSW
jgi:adenosylcobyric acid synthase